MSAETPTSAPAAAPAPPPPAGDPVGIERLPDVSRWPDGAREVSPLLLVMFGVALPVALVALACVGGSTAVLIVALLAMIVMGGVTMAFMTLITTDPEHKHNMAEDEEA